MDSLGIADVIPSDNLPKVMVPRLNNFSLSTNNNFINGK
jgi:hypothetical protein